MSNNNAQTIPISQRERLPIKVFAVYNYQTESVEEQLVSVINEYNARIGQTVIDYTSECVEDVETLIGRPSSDGADVVLNLINYFPETYDYDQESRVSFMHNIVSLESILGLCESYADPLLINLSLNNAFYLALNDRFQAEKMEIFMEHKVEQLMTLRAQKSVKWLNIETGYITSTSDKLVFSQFGKEYFVNSTVNVNPIPTNAMFDSIVSLILRCGSVEANRTLRLMSNKTQTLYQYFSEQVPTATIHRYIDFIEENPCFKRYASRFNASEHIG